jgi:hypothetical protein
MRKRILRLLITLAILAGLLAPWFSPPPIQSGVYVQAVTSSGAVVAQWTAHDSERRLRVRKAGTEVRTVGPTAKGRRHELALDALEPACDYTYEVLAADDSIVGAGRFRTRSESDSDRIEFAIVGDTGGQPWWVWLQQSPLMVLTRGRDRLPPRSEPARIGEALAAAAPHFVLHTGDVIYPKGAAEHYWSGLFLPFEKLMAQSPVFPVLGNHDCMTENGKPFLDSFVLPADEGAERCFTFRDGPLRVIGLDLNDTMRPDHPSLAYLRKVASSSAEPFLLVYSHYPVRSVYRDHPRKDLETHYIPLCRELGVDLICAGHDHQYQRYGQPGETIELVTGGGGKSLYEIHHRPVGLVTARSEYHACYVTVSRARLTLTARTPDDVVLDEFTIDLGKAVREGTFRGSAARRARIEAILD